MIGVVTSERMSVAAPRLETPRLRLEPFAEGHLTPRYVGWLNDAAVMRFSERRHCRHSVESCRDYVRTMASAGNYLWAIVGTDQAFGHIGNIAAYVDVNNRLADVTILIGERKAWGRGFGTEAWAAVCDFLLGPAGLRKVTGGTLAANRAMVRIMERSGMIADGRRARHYLLDGGEVDLVHFARFHDRD